MKKIVLYAATAVMLTAVAQAQNANVTWQAPTTVSGASDVSAQGLYYGSWAPYDGNANSLPVNGVTFQGFSDLPGFNTSGFDSGYNSFPNPGTGDNNYNTLLQYGAYDGSGNGNDTVTWTDIPGHTYLIQIWANGNAANRSETITGGANTSDTINYGNSAQYIVGTYVADGSGSETITLSGAASGNGNYPQVNLLQVRDISEPSITWQAPANIKAASDVSTQGTYFGSWAPYASSSLPVNGVTFQNNSDLPNFSNTGFNAGYNAFPNPGTTDNNYNTLLQSGAYEYPGPACTFSWGGMTPGHTYLLQFWVNGSDPNRTETLSGGTNTSASINYSPGQYIIGTFVANGSGSETVTLNGNPSDNYPQVNLVQVRDITSTTFSNYQSAVISDQPIGYWPLDLSEDTNTIGGYYVATDYSGNGNYGVYYNISPGNLTAGPAPFITNAVSFSSAEVDLSQGPNTTLLNFTGPTTLEAWVQPSQPAASLSTLGDIIAKGYDSGNYQEIALRENASAGPNYYGSFGTGGVSGGAQSTNWVYLVVANDGTSDYLYINGQLVQKSADTRGSIPFANAISWAIGNGTSGGNGRTFNGNICQVAMYNYGLSAAQVLKHYYAAELNTSPNSAPPIIVSQPQGQGSYVGGSVTFSVTALSALPTTNLWYQGNTPLTGQTNSTLTLTNLQLSSAGNYRVVVGNANGTTNSVAANLTVTVPNHLEWSANNNNGTWDVDASLNWLNTSTSAQTVFNQGDQVAFDDTPNVPTSVTVSGTVSPSLITVNSSANNFNISSGTISGSGSLVKEGTSALTITSAAGLSGTATVGGGTFYAGNNCLNSISGIIVSNNATLDFGGSSFGSIKPVKVSGTGFNGEGALYNSYDNDPSEALNVTLAGDTLFSGSHRWDLASGSQISGPHYLTTDWSTEVNDGQYAQWNSVTIGNVLGITVTNSQAANGVTNSLGFTGMDSSFQNPSTVVTVCSNAQLIFYSGGFNGSIHLQSGASLYHYSAPAGFYGSTLVMDGGSAFYSYYNGGQTTPIDSAVTLNGVVHFVTGNHYMDYTNVISGVGGFVLDYYDNAMSFSAPNTYTGPTIIGSSGNTPIVALTGNGSISHSSLIFFGGNNPAVGHIDASGRVDQTLTLASGQTLEGIGGINGSLVVSPGAIVSPGGTNTTIGITTGSNPVGTIVASANIALNGTTIIKLDGTTNDIIDAATNITYGGTLNLANISGSPLAAGSSFQIFQAASYSGAFTSITPATPGAGLAWNKSQLSSGIISVVTSTQGVVIQPPSVSNGNFVFSGTGGTSGAPYYVLASTNLLTPLSGWAVTATNTFDSNGNFSVTNPLSAGSRQLFYTIRQ